jgi:hypothetical protein
MSNKPSSVLGVGTTRSAHKIGWLTYFRDIPTAGFGWIGMEGRRFGDRASGLEALDRRVPAATCVWS